MCSYANKEFFFVINSSFLFSANHLHFCPADVAHSFLPVVCTQARGMFTCTRHPWPLAHHQFSSSLQLEARLKASTAQVRAALCALAPNADLSLEQQRLFTDVLGVLASLPTHAEFAKTAGVQKHARELCKCLVEGIKRVGKSLDDRIGEMLAGVFVAELYRPQPTFLPAPDLLLIFGELCLVSAKTRACAVERSASHQIAALISQAGDRPVTQKQAYIALCKLLVMVDDTIFESRFVDLLVRKTIETPHDVEYTTWMLTVLYSMQEKNDRALEYIWKQSAVSGAILNVLRSNGCPENTSKIARLLRMPVRVPELRMLLARSGVWEVLHDIVCRPDVNNMTLQRVAEVFQQLATCPCTGPMLVGLNEYRTLLVALQQVKGSDTVTLQALLLCAHTCCVHNKAFGAQIAGLGLLQKMHQMCIQAHLSTLSIFFASNARRFFSQATGKVQRQDMSHMLASEMRELTHMLRADAPAQCASKHFQGTFVDVWANFVRDVPPSDIRALAPDLVCQFKVATLGSSRVANVGMAPALHLLARAACCRSDVVVAGDAVRRLSERAAPHMTAALCTGLLALAHASHISKSSDAAPHASTAAPAKPKAASVEAVAEYRAAAANPATATNAKRMQNNIFAVVDADVVRTSSPSPTDVVRTSSPSPTDVVRTSSSAPTDVVRTSSSVPTDAADTDTDNEHSGDDTEARSYEAGIGLTKHDIVRMLEAFPTPAELPARALCLWPMFSAADLDALCDKFVAAFQGTPSQCLLAMNAIEALLSEYADCALNLVRGCGLVQLWRAVEKHMHQCDAATGAEFIETFASICEHAKKVHEHELLHELLDQPFFSALFVNLTRAVSVHEHALAQAIVMLLHRVLDAKPDLGAVLLLAGVTATLLSIRDALAPEAGRGASLHVAVGELLHRLVPPQHAALLRSFERHRALQPELEGVAQRKRKRTHEEGVDV